MAATTSLLVDLTKFGSGPWYPAQCFELTFTAAYKDQDALDAYKSFTTDETPVCKPLAQFDIDCKVKENTSDTIQFTLKDIS